MATLSIQSLNSANQLLLVSAFAIISRSSTSRASSCSCSATSDSAALVLVAWDAFRAARHWASRSIAGRRAGTSAGRGTERAMNKRKFINVSAYLVLACKLASRELHRSSHINSSHLFLIVLFPIPYSLRLLHSCQAFSNTKRKQPWHQRVSDHFLHGILAFCCLPFSGFLAKGDSLLSARVLGKLYDDQVSRRWERWKAALPTVITFTEIVFFSHQPTFRVRSLINVVVSRDREGYIVIFLSHEP